ncbi:MAG: acyl-CoA dehydrogenase family protein, partial [Chloroflexi bacterium]|nr:acyl-CoA dehydrogenase family protein [Chloroflexota bacterium]
MNFQLRPVTEPGRRFVELAEKHAADFATRADKYDRKGVFPSENIEDLKRSGAMAATVPVEYGGMGVESVHDLAVGINRLGRGDGSTAIGVTMHLFRPWRMTRRLKAVRQGGDAS